MFNNKTEKGTKPKDYDATMKSGHVRVTTVEMVHVKTIFTAFSFNLHKVPTLKKQGLV